MSQHIQKFLIVVVLNIDVYRLKTSRVNIEIQIDQTDICKQILYQSIIQVIMFT